MSATGERMIEVEDVELWTESFGDPADPTILLNAGGGAPGIVWSEAFCQRLADGRRHVIRYDYRDTGLSSKFDFAIDPYTISDLTADAIGLLDSYGIASAHFVGWSMGGVIAQTAAFDHPGRVASVVSISSTPLRGSLYTGGDGGLPGNSRAFQEAGAAITALPRSDIEGRVDAFVAFFRAGGTTEPFDERELRAFAKRAFTRAPEPANPMNNALAIASTRECREKLAWITVPVLVIHGTNDLVLGVAHGEATADAIPGAKLLIIDGMGHIPRPEPREMLTAILDHTAPVEVKS